MEDSERLAQNRQSFLHCRLAFLEGKFEFLNQLALLYVRLSVDSSSLARDIQVESFVRPSNPYDPASSQMTSEQFDAGWNEVAERFRQELEHGNRA